MSSRRKSSHSHFAIALVSVLLLVLLTSAVLSGCSSSRTVDTGNKLTVGALLPLSGSWKTTGDSAEAALLAALDIIHAQLPVELGLGLRILDTAGDPETALAQLKILHEDGVRIVIGPMTSSEADAVREYADTHDMLLVSPSATASDLSYDDSLIMLSPNDSHQSDALVKLMKAGGITTVAVMHIDDLYGRSFHREFAKAATAAGITVLPAVSLNTAAPDYSSAIIAVERAVAGKSPTSTSVLLLENDLRAAALVRNIDPASPLRSLRWYAGESIITSPLFVEDATLATFATTTGLEGFTLAVESDLFDSSRPLVQTIISERLQGAISPYALTTWDALWLIAYTQRLTPYRSTPSFKADLIAESASFANIFSFANPLDGNGNVLACRYARFQVVERDNGSFAWQYAGTYVKPSASAAFSVDFVKPHPSVTGNVTIGALLPLTGQSSQIGVAAQQALNAAVTMANKYFATTVPGMSYSIEVRDTGGNPIEALRMMEELHGKGIVTFVGPYTSSEVEAVAGYAASVGITLISPAATAPSLATAGHATMFLTPNDNNQAIALASLMEEQGIEHVIVLYRDDIYGRELSLAFATAFSGSTSMVAYDANDFDATAIVAAAASHLPETAGTTALLAVSYEEIAGILSAVPAGSPLLEMQWFGADGTSQLESLAIARAASVRFTATIFSHYGPGETSVIPALISTMSAGQTGVTTYGVNSYDAFWFLAAAYAEVGPGASGDTVWTTLNRSPYFTGIGGAFDLDENGQRTFGIFQFHTVMEDDSIYRWALSAAYLNNYLFHGELIYY